MDIVEKKAYFIDYEGNEQYANIRFNNGISLGIDTFDDKNNHTGYMRIYFHTNNRLYLDVIYCYDEFRGSGIASFISELSDYILSDYEGYVIRGVYEPGQLSTDRENKIERSLEELDLRARKFYSRAGYDIINYEDYSNNKDKYPYLNDDDFVLGEDSPNTIVAKPIKPKENFFYEIDEVIYHINYNKITTRNK